MNLSKSCMFLAAILFICLTNISYGASANPAPQPNASNPQTITDNFENANEQIDPPPINAAAEIPADVIVDTPHPVGNVNQTTATAVTQPTPAPAQNVNTQAANQNDITAVFGTNAKTDLPKIGRRSKGDPFDPMADLSNAKGGFVGAAAEAALKAKNDKGAKKQIKEIHETYNKMLEAFANNDQKNSKKFYKKLMRQFSDANIESGLLYFLFDDFEEILAKLDDLYAVDAASSPVVNLQKTIPLTMEDQALVEKYITAFSQPAARQRITQALQRAELYKNIVEPTLADFNLPPELKYLPVIESLYIPTALSKAGALGLWQIMPSRARALGLQVNYWIDERLDPQKSTEAAALYLKQLFLMLGDWHLALAAYNRGEYGLVRDMKSSNASTITEMVQRNAIPKETQNYIPQFIAIATIARNPEKYGFKIDKNIAPLRYDVVKINKVMDLKIAAQASGTTLEEIKRLNPALKAWCTPQGYPDFELKIPYGSTKIFLENIAKIKDLNPTPPPPPAPAVIKYKVVKNDNLSTIAKTYKTSVNEILKSNPNLKAAKYLQP
ncbi:MAG: transglycosylase SLT domain-containing protein, partial [Elusimicrobiota bacterium]|nr:transglycosylase SLT domain-containing protein [Elusimicrobiota bacterium]